jgi:CheY-like chemotaxis protein
MRSAMRLSDSVSPGDNRYTLNIIIKSNIFSLYLLLLYSHPPKNPNMASTVNILLADDSVDEQFLFVHTFKSIDPDVRISTAINGVELIKMLNIPETRLPDLLFLDLNMPLKNGKESLAEIRKNPKLTDLRIIIYSTSDERRDIYETYALGANIYVRKPQDYLELEKTLAKLISIYRERDIARLPRSKYVFSLVD